MARPGPKPRPKTVTPEQAEDVVALIRHFDKIARQANPARRARDARICELHDAGYSHRDIADMTGVAKIVVQHAATGARRARLRQDI